MVRKPKGIWRRFKYWLRTTYWITTRKVAIVLAGVAVLVVVLGSLAQHGLITVPQLVLDLWGNVSSELAGIVITVWVIDTLNRRRSIAVEKEDLILQMGSPDNAFALEAVRKLKARGWGFGEDRSLNRKQFWKANLENAELDNFNLRDSDMPNVNLQHARLADAILQKVLLSGANMQDAKLWRTDLERALLMEANLKGAELVGANLRGANLRDANLVDANLNLAQFDSATVLPDDAHWNVDIDMARFTQASNPNFWRSESNDLSPAYRHKDRMSE